MRLRIEYENIYVFEMYCKSNIKLSHQKKIQNASKNFHKCVTPIDFEREKNRLNDDSIRDSSKLTWNKAKCVITHQGVSFVVKVLLLPMFSLIQLQ